MKLRLAVAFLCLAVVGAAIPPARADAGTAANVAGTAVRHWTLPTGSRIAFRHEPASGPEDRGAVVFLHGGPGASEVYAWEFASAWIGRLARAGFDVYFYDQIGSGLSARLDDPQQYTVARHVADLEQIRRAIGRDRLILLGESWGATLAAHYLAAHRDRVERIAFISPGALEPAGRKAAIYPYASPRIVPELLDWIGRRRGAAARERYAGLNRLLQGDVVAAHALAGDAEMDEWWGTYVNEAILRTCVHDPASLARDGGFAIPGMGWWAGLMTSWDAVNRDYAVRARLAGSRLPVLVLRGDSDYLPPEYAADYVAVFPQARYVSVPNAGHLIWMERPDVYRREIESFLVPGGLPSVALTAATPR